MHYSIFQSPNNVHARIISPSCEDMYMPRCLWSLGSKTFLWHQQVSFSFSVCTCRVVLLIVMLHTIKQNILNHLFITFNQKKNSLRNISVLTIHQWPCIMFTYTESLSVMGFLMFLVWVCAFGSPFLSTMTDGLTS